MAAMQAPDSAASCWDRAFRDHRLSPAERRAYIAKGILAADTALTRAPGDADTRLYKALLLRLQALDQADPRAGLQRDADRLLGEAAILSKKKMSGV
jgi:hypothetical protein